MTPESTKEAVVGLSGGWAAGRQTVEGKGQSGFVSKRRDCGGVGFVRWGDARSQVAT